MPQTPNLHLQPRTDSLLPPPVHLNRNERRKWAKIRRFPSKLVSKFNPRRDETDSTLVDVAQKPQTVPGGYPTIPVAEEHNIIEKAGGHSEEIVPNTSGVVPFVYAHDLPNVPEGLVCESPEPARRLSPRKPTQGDRYERLRLPPAELERVVLHAGPAPIKNISQPPGDWEEAVHPEGQLLYSKVILARSRSIRIHTDFALREPENHLPIYEAVELLSELLVNCDALDDPELPDDDIEAVIQVVETEEQEIEFGYYLANHRDQTIIWLEDIHAEDLELVAREACIVKLKLQVEYWRHVTDFPCYSSLSPKVWDQLSPTLLLGAVDQEYCEDSTAPKDATTLAKLESYWRKAKKDRDDDCNRTAYNWICARLWFDLITPRVHNFWGTNYARLERTTEVVGFTKPSDDATPWLIRWFCALFLWNEPLVTMQFLDDAWPGGVIYQKPWSAMMNIFTIEWERIIVLSAITFAGALSFLALPLQASPGNGSREGSLPIQGGVALAISAETASLIATMCGLFCCIFSVASLVAAVNLKRDFGGKITQDVHVARAYLESLEGGALGYLKLGVCLSLPRVLFMWAVISFCVGLALLAYLLHLTKLGFFWAEISMSALLFMMVAGARALSPKRIKPESMFRLRRRVGTAKQFVTDARHRASTMMPEWTKRRTVIRNSPTSANPELGLTIRPEEKYFESGGEHTVPG